jgi:hypothetical protein
MTYQSQQLVYALQKQGVVTKNATNPTLQSFYNSNINSNIGKFTDVQDAVASNNKTLAQNKNNSINPTNAVQQKTRRANELMLKLNINCNYRFTNTELQDLMSMANECEVKGWYVAEARSILNSISGTLINYLDNCEDTKASARMANNEDEPISTLIEPKRSFILFPNPANTDVNFVIDGIAENETCAISIYDINGRLMTEFNVQENKLPKSVSLSTFSSGIYFYKAITGDKIYQNKLVIIK